jgi:hypothetical protein
MSVGRQSERLGVMWISYDQLPWGMVHTLWMNVVDEDSRIAELR